MRKSIAQISSQFSSDPPEEAYTGAITDPSFVIKIEAETRKEWHRKAQNVITQAKADTSDIMERYDDAVKVRHPQELNEILTALRSDLAPHNSAIDKLMIEYMQQEEKRYKLLETWEQDAEATAQRASAVGLGLEEKVQQAVAEDKAAVADYNKDMGRIRRPRRTDDTAVTSDEDGDV